MNQTHPAAVIEILGSKLTRDQAQAIFTPILVAGVESHRRREGLAARHMGLAWHLRPLARVAKILGPELLPEQAEDALCLFTEAVPELIKAIPNFGGDSEGAEVPGLIFLARAIQVLGPRVMVDRSGPAIEAARSVLKRTAEPTIAEAFARAIAVTLSADPDEPYVAMIVELLKWPTTVGPATDTLLEVLHERVPGAPAKEAGLDAIIAWIAANYPDIDLDSPPTFPASGSTGGAW